MLTYEAKAIWQQCVVSKSGAEPHIVRGFDNGAVTCDCKGYKYNSKCSHQPIGKIQEARESLAQADLLISRDEPTWQETPRFMADDDLISSAEYICDQPAEYQADDDFDRFLNSYELSQEGGPATVQIFTPKIAAYAEVWS